VRKKEIIDSWLFMVSAALLLSGMLSIMASMRMAWNLDPDSGYFWFWTGNVLQFSGLILLMYAWVTRKGSKRETAEMNQESAEIWFCRHCGNLEVQESFFCPKCGKPLRENLERRLND